MKPFAGESREAWAKHDRTPDADMFEYLQVSSAIADYAAAAEIADIVAQLEEQWRSEGRKQRAARRAAGSLSRRQDENALAYHARLRAMSPSDYDLAVAFTIPQDERHQIPKALKLINEGELPIEVRLRAAATAILASVIARYQAAYDVARDKREEEILATPIDNAASAEELRRLADLNAGRGMISVRICIIKQGRRETCTTHPTMEERPCRQSFRSKRDARSVIAPALSSMACPAGWKGAVKHLKSRGTFDERVHRITLVADKLLPDPVVRATVNVPNVLPRRAGARVSDAGR